MIDRPDEKGVGLFGFTHYATITNITLKGISVMGDVYVGGLAGNTYAGIVSNSSVSGVVSGFMYVGGFIGFNGSNISNSSASCVVEGGHTMGGFIGCNDRGGKISDSYATGAVSGEGIAGGFIGENKTGEEISNSYATGAVSGWNAVGGFIGVNFLGDKISNSYATGAVSGINYVGGFIGANSWGSAISKSYSTGDVTGIDYVGGFIGANSWLGAISESYSTGDVIGIDLVGGFIGSNDSGGDVFDSYSTGAVSGEGSASGFIGSNYSGIVTNSYARLIDGDNNLSGDIGDILGALGTDWQGSTWGVTEDNFPYLKNLASHTVTITGDVEATIVVNRGVTAIAPVAPDESVYIFAGGYDFASPLTGDFALTAELKYSASSNDALTEPSFKAFPTRTTGVLTVTGLKAGAVIHVYSAIGMLVATIRTVDAETTQIDIASLPSGIYFLCAADRAVRVIKR